MPEDLQITLVAPAITKEWFVNGFLECHPIPINDDPESPTFGEPLYGIKEWIKMECIKEILRIPEEGNKRLHAETRIKVDNALI